MVQALEGREVKQEELPRVCPLCWDWILEGQAVVKLEEGPAHRECWQKGEAN